MNNHYDYDRYIPALRYDWLTPLYDPLIRWTMRESTFKRHLLEQARIQRDHRVLDLGCGTATLTVLIKKASQGAEVVGLDGNLKVLEFARRKVARARVNITLEHGMAFALPYPDAFFDRVLSSLMFHHLTRENKSRTLKEVFRVLRPGGELHVVDFGQPHNVLMRLISLLMRRLEETSDNIAGQLPQMFRDAGFVAVMESTRYLTMFGTLSLYRARRPR